MQTHYLMRGRWSKLRMMTLADYDVVTMPQSTTPFLSPALGLRAEASMTCSEGCLNSILTTF